MARGGERCPCSCPVSDTRLSIMTGSPVSQEWQVGSGGGAGEPDPQGEEVRAQRGIYCKAGRMAAQSPGIGTASQQSGRDTRTWGGLGGEAQAHPQGAQSACGSPGAATIGGGVCRGRSPSAACALWAWGRQPGTPKVSSTALGPPSNQTERNMRIRCSLGDVTPTRTGTQVCSEAAAARSWLCSDTSLSQPHTHESSWV